jgi:hypothetical protein
MNKNNKLNKSKFLKNDEFYTPLNVIEDEIKEYYEYDKDVFRDKIVYLNCDNPYESNFFKYFVSNFNKFGLKKLIATNYSGDDVPGSIKTLFDDGCDRNIANKVIINEVIDNEYDLDVLLKNNKNAYEILKGDDVYPPGDFRSKECVELLKESDIVVTNPPFSLFRVFIDLLIKYDKKFIVLGSNVAISYKNVFIYFKKKQLWFGTKNNFSVSFMVKNNQLKQVAVSWFTNIKHSKMPNKLNLKSMKENLEKNKKYPYLYKEYDNFHAIEVPYTKLIPNDYNGAMGVPITFLYFYNPEQFEILTTNRMVDEFGYSFLKKKNDDVLDCKINDKELFVRVFIKLKK